MIVFSEKNIINTTLAQLTSQGFKCQNYGTVIECYKKDQEKIYWHEDKRVFFKNAVADEKVKTLKLIVAGGRDFRKWTLLRDTLDHILRSRKPEEVIIVCGEAPGADSLGKHYGLLKGIKVKSFSADWDGQGRAAGPLRNSQMAEYANACVCFWDGRSKGTAHMIRIAEEKGLRLKVVPY